MTAVISIRECRPTIKYPSDRGTRHRNDSEKGYNLGMLSSCRRFAGGSAERLVWALLASASLTSSCFAAEVENRISKTGIAGAPVSLTGHMRHNERCIAPGLPKITLKIPPDNGTVCVKQEKTQKQGSSFNREDRECLGKIIDGVSVYYLPAGRFQGVDTLEYLVDFGRSREGDEQLLNMKVQVTVKPSSQPASPNTPAPFPFQQQEPGPVPSCVQPVS